MEQLNSPDICRSGMWHILVQAFRWRKASNSIFIKLYCVRSVLRISLILNLNYLGY